MKTVGSIKLGKISATASWFIVLAAVIVSTTVCDNVFVVKKLKISNFETCLNLAIMNSVFENFGTRESLSYAISVKKG